MISPLLANIYLHYVLDLWAERWRRREAQGDLIIVRYADDLVAGFEHQDDARRIPRWMRDGSTRSRWRPPGRTRLIEFGRHAAARRARSGFGRPETFTFLGFTYICGHPAGDTSSFKGRPGATVSGRSYRKSRRSYGGECTSQSLFRDPG